MSDHIFPSAITSSAPFASARLEAKERSLFLVGDVGLAAVGWYFSGQRLYVFADGVCHERRGAQECYRWKDVEKVVYYASTPGVYWLYFKNGRKVSVSILDGMKKKDWLAVREYLERNIGDKFVDEG